ncbi:MAG: glutamate racemase, partial [Pseudomonadota bacterium]|nr:glutamate racemase [Pseudomonadota bacterium]
PYVADLAARFAADCTMLCHGSAELVALAEAKLAGETIDAAAISLALAPLLAQQGAAAMDTIVLACTHFPLLAKELAIALPGVALIDGGPGIARRIATLTRDQSWPDVAPEGRAVFTGGAPSATLAAALGRFGLATVSGF